MKGKVIDLFMFMGQSNMAGRGIVSEEYPQEAPELTSGAGYEYRAVSAPDKLVEIKEPFGHEEDRLGGIDDGKRKTGSMVTSFVNAYYKKTGIPIVAVSASKGGSKIEEWQPKGVYLQDAVTRLQAAVSYLEQNGYEIRHKYMAWCQGESDGDIAKPGKVYREDFERMLKDAFHYYQEAYNEVGTEAGMYAAYFVETGKEPVIPD